MAPSEPKRNGPRAHRALTRSEAETRELGRRLGSRLAGGDIVLLEGPLGAGKTALVRGLVAGLSPEAEGLVASPSYVIVGEYPTRPVTVHVDLYRLSSTEEVIGLGWEELLHGGKLALVEWPALLEPLLEPDDPVVRVDIAPGAGEDEREISMTASDPRLDEALAWAAAC